MFSNPVINSKVLKDRRRDLKNNQTGAEGLLWQYLRRRELGVRFYRQFGIENFIVDFCCRKKKIIIEVDGGIHDKEEVKRKDLTRSRVLKSFGYKILRFKNFQVLNNPEEVAKEIKKFVEEN